MNERILELANKANEDVGYTFKLEDAKQLHELMEKFAELLIRECMQVANTYQNRGGNIYVDNKIAEHFGVEE